MLLPDTQDKQHHSKSLDAVAGAIAGCVSRFIVGPLDVIKIRFQVQLEPLASLSHPGQASKYTGFVQAFKTILKEEGVRVRRPGLVLCASGQQWRRYTCMRVSFQP